MLQLLAEWGLMPREKGLRIAPVSRQLECSEVLPPWAIRHFRIGADPETQGYQIILSDFALAQSFDEVLPQPQRKRMPTDLRHY